MVWDKYNNDDIKNIGLQRSVDDWCLNSLLTSFFTFLVVNKCPYNLVGTLHFQHIFFSNSQLVSTRKSGEIKKLQSDITEKQNAISELEGKVEQKDTEIQETETKLKIAEDKMVREKTLAELVAPLSKDKRQVMVELLESVQTANLKKQFDKYLPAVLNETAEVQESANIITEHTGDRINNQSINSNESDDIVNIKRLAGLRS